MVLVFFKKHSLILYLVMKLIFWVNWQPAKYCIFTEIFTLVLFPQVSRDQQAPDNCASWLKNC